jgi:hypothetical protein
LTHLRLHQFGRQTAQVVVDQQRKQAAAPLLLEAFPVQLISGRGLFFCFGSSPGRLPGKVQQQGPDCEAQLDTCMMTAHTVVRILAPSHTETFIEPAHNGINLIRNLYRKKTEFQHGYVSLELLLVPRHDFQKQVFPP